MMNSIHSRDPRVIIGEVDDEDENITSVTQLYGPSVFSKMGEESESVRSNTNYQDYFPSKEIFTNALKLSELWDMGMFEYKPLTEAQLTSLMSQMEKRSSNEHVCLVYSKPPSHLQFNPYSLQIVRPKDINNSSFFTLSKYGFIFFSNVFPEFTEYIQMIDFIQEMRMYERVHKIKFFQQFCLWKIFSTWAKNIRILKFQKARCNLERNLIVIKPTFSMVIPKILKLVNEMSSLCFIKLEDNHVYTLEEFMFRQKSYLKTIKFTLQEFQSHITELVMSVYTDSTILFKFQESFIQIVDYVLNQAYHKLLKRSLLTLMWEIKLRTDPQIFDDEDKRFVRLCTDLGIDVESYRINLNEQPLFSLDFHFNWNESSDESFYNYSPSETMLKSAFTDLIHMWTENIVTISSIKDCILDINRNDKQIHQIRRQKMFSLLETDSDLQYIQKNIELYLAQALKTCTIFFTTPLNVISRFCRNSKVMDPSNFETCKGLKKFKAQFEGVRKAVLSITTNVHEKFHQGVFQFNDNHLIEIVHTSLTVHLEVLQTVKLSHSMKCTKCKKIKILNKLIDSMEKLIRIIDRDSQRSLEHDEIVIKTLRNGILETIENLNISLDTCQLIENQLHLYHLDMKEKKHRGKNSCIDSTIINNTNVSGNLIEKLCILKELCKNNQNHVINQRALLEKLHYTNTTISTKMKLNITGADNNNNQ